MIRPVASRLIPLAFALFCLLAAPAAHADCPAPLSNFDASYCEVQDFNRADMSLNLVYKELTSALAPGEKNRLRDEELAWIHRRDNACTYRANNGVFVNFKCAAAMTVSRTNVLRARLDSATAELTYSGHYLVRATAMPWLWQPGGLNASYGFGAQDGIGPLILTLAGLQAKPGGILLVRYLSGEISTGMGSPMMDANGFANFDAFGANGITGKPMPNRYMSPYPINVGSLVGAFTTRAGRLVGAPFALGDRPTQLTIPAGAAQLQLGINDDLYADNTGAFTIAVTTGSTI